MKKLLASAALVAAGSAFAGAVDYETSGNTYYGTTEWLTSSYGNYYAFAFSLSNLTTLSTSLTTSSVDSSVSIEEGASYLVTSISTALNSSSQSKDGNTYMVIVDSDFTVLAISAVADLNGLNDGSNRYYQTNSGKAFDDYVFEDALILTAGITYYALGFNDVSSISVGDTITSDNWSAAYFRLMGSTDSYSDSNGIATSTNNALDGTFGTMSVALEIALTEVTIVPEPGSFGLLAGVAALAFAASRRRRSRKAA